MALESVVVGVVGERFFYSSSLFAEGGSCSSTNRPLLRPGLKVLLYFFLFFQTVFCLLAAFSLKCAIGLMQLKERRTFVGKNISLVQISSVSYLFVAHTHIWQTLEPTGRGRE